MDIPQLDSLPAGQMVINDILHEKIKNAFLCQELGRITVNNKANPITIYEVL